MSAANILNSPITAAPAITGAYSGSGGGAGVASINGATGAITVAAGSGIGVATVGTTVTITNTGGGPTNFLPLAGGTMDAFPAGVINAHTIVGPPAGILLLDAGALGDVNVQATGGNASLGGDTANVSAVNGIDINSTGAGPIGVDTTGTFAIGSILQPSSISMTSIGNVELTANGTSDIIMVSDEVQIGKAGVLTFPTLKLISGTDPIEFLTMTYDSSIDKGTIKTEINGQLLFQGGSSFTMDSGGTMLFTASDPITLQAKSGDSIMLMDSDITMTATTDNFNLNGSIAGSAVLNVNGGMVLTSDAAKAEFKNAAGVLKGSMGYNVGTDYMDLTGSAGFEINTTVGDLNMTANGGKINMTTNGNNIEIFGNTTGGFFADVNIGSSDGDLDIGIGGNIIMNAGTTGGNITVTAFADFSVSSTTVKLPTLPTASTEYQLFYNTSTKDVTYGAAFPAITVQAATGTIALTAAMNRSTYILTGTSATQSFSQAGLVGVAAGWCVYLRNGNNATGGTQDITISIPAGNTTLHAPTGTTNSSFILLYWNGSALVSYR